MRLIIPFALWQQMQAYAEASLPNEVTGFGTIKYLKRNQFLVTELFLVHQQVSRIHCASDDYAVNELIAELLSNKPDRSGDLRFRWHSHANGRCFWSKIDQHDINQTMSPWVVNLVINTHGESLARLDLFEPLRLKNLPLKLTIDYSLDQTLATIYQAEVRQKVKPLPICQSQGKEVKFSDGLFRSEKVFRPRNMGLARTFSWRWRH